MFSWFGSNNKWKKLPPPNTTAIRQELMSIGQSIWFCTDYDQGEKGIVEFNTTTNKYSIIPYPKHLGAIKWHSCCNNKHLIYIVNGLKGDLITFNTKTKQFKRL